MQPSRLASFRTAFAVAVVGAALAMSSAGLASAAVDHFLCYEGRRPALGLKGVSAVDQYGASTVTVRQAKRLCAPVNKNGEDPTAPSHPGHLSFYTIKQTSPRFVGPRKVSVRDQFGTLSVDLVRPERLLVPTAKSLTAPPPPLATPIDHYKCYRVRGARLRVPSVTVETQFGPLVVAIKRPRDLCVPVDANGQGVVDPSRGLMCYQVRTAPQREQPVFTTDQFGSAAYDIFGVRDLCVPLEAGPGICGDGTINAPGERCETGVGNDAACPGACDTVTCTCSGAPASTPTATPGTAPTRTGEPTSTSAPTATRSATPVASATFTATPSAGATPTVTATPLGCGPDGTPCNDGNACTTVDTCQAGTCTGSNPVACTASDQCHTAGTCNPTTGVCSNPAKANGAGCNDANACTQIDTCQAGTCTGSNPVTCTASDQCHNAGTCNTATGVCSNPAKANGAVCNDANACTQTDTCQGGTCTGSNPVSCGATQCRNAGTCNPATGTCSGTPKVDGTLCNDSSLCTLNDHCENGACTGDSSCPGCFEECRTTCDPGTGVCQFGASPTGTPCDDPIAPVDPECALPSTCADNACHANAKPDGSPCGGDTQCSSTGQQRTCQSGRCTPEPVEDGTACNDGALCTVGDTCQAGYCTGHQKLCDDRQALNFDTCNPTTGLCEHAPDPTRPCSCFAPLRCCREADGAGGFDPVCVSANPVIGCEDQTGVFGNRCTATGGGQFVCPEGRTCCGDQCCRPNAGEVCFEGQCVVGTPCGDNYCASGELCSVSPTGVGTCTPVCGGNQLVCGAGDVCCPGIGNGKCCSNGSVCGPTDCVAPCGPNEVMVHGTCCLAGNACGIPIPTRCCDSNEVCDTCSGAGDGVCSPKP